MISNFLFSDSFPCWNDIDSIWHAFDAHAFFDSVDAAASSLEGIDLESGMLEWQLKNDE